MNICVLLWMVFFIRFEMECEWVGVDLVWLSKLLNIFTMKCNYWVIPTCYFELMNLKTLYEIELTVMGSVYCLPILLFLIVQVVCVFLILRTVISARSTKYNVITWCMVAESLRCVLFKIFFELLLHLQINFSNIVWPCDSTLTYSFVKLLFHMLCLYISCNSSLLTPWIMVIININQLNKT